LRARHKASLRIRDEGSSGLPKFNTCTVESAHLNFRYESRSDISPEWLNTVHIDAKRVFAHILCGGARDECVMQVCRDWAHPVGRLNGGYLARPADALATSRSQSIRDAFRPKEWQEEIFRRVEKVANDKGWKISQVALACISDNVTSPIAGFSSVSIPSA
jgi:hypothetical protein